MGDAKRSQKLPILQVLTERWTDEEAARLLYIMVGCDVVGVLLALGLPQLEDQPHVHTFGLVSVGLWILCFALLSAGSLIAVIPQLLNTSLRVFGWEDVLQFAGYVLYLAPTAFGNLCQDLYLQFGGFTGVHGSDSWGALGKYLLTNDLTFSAIQEFSWASPPIVATAWWSHGLIVLFGAIVGLLYFSGIVNLIRATLGLLRRQMWKARHRAA